MQDHEMLPEESVASLENGMNTAVETAYTAAEFTVLEGLEAVRRRPGMYVADTGMRGLHQLFFEVIDNSIDEALAGYCTDIHVVLYPDQSLSVEDNGRGIPVDVNAETGQTGVELAMTRLHAGSKFGGGGYRVSGGLHGVGVSCVNALSEWLEVRVKRDGKLHFQRFERGVPCGSLQVIGEAEGTGTRVTWHPDPEIFGSLVYDAERLRRRIRELAFLNRQVRIVFENLRDGEEPEVYHYTSGISEFVKYLNENKDPLHKPIYLARSRDDVQVEIALQYNAGYQENIVSFANNIHTTEGGTHVSGLKTAMTRVINQYARKSGMLKEKDSNFSGDDVREGLTAVVSVLLLNPQFEGQTKTKLGNGEIEGIVNSVVGESLSIFFEENPMVAKRIVEKSQLAQRARDAARKAADLVKRQSALENTSLPGKLADCSDRDPSNCELFIVEGDSAGGSAKQGRDRRTQAVLPLRGKILNVEKARLDKALENEMIRALITALGTGIANEAPVANNGNGNGNGHDPAEAEEEAAESKSTFDLSKLRYHKIIIMTDADVDGDHIRTLLLTFFFRYMRPLILQGHIYIAQPPLYVVKAGKDERYYAHNEKELDEIVKRIRRKNVMVGRFKGLGEMNAEELAETTMNPEKRTLVRVEMEDALAADAMFNILMGDKVEPRKEYIVRHASQVTNLDWHA